MAVHKAKRFNPLAQPQPQHAKHARVRGPKRARRRSNPQLKSQGFEILQHLNRGYGIALHNLERLEHLDNKDKPETFPRSGLRDLRNRTEELRALANHNLLQTLVSREERDALRFGRLRAQHEKPSARTGRQ